MSAMTAGERRAVTTLASLFSLRMIGLFMIMPVFALYGRELDGATPLLIGLAIGLVPAIILLVIFGVERGVKAIAFIIPVTTFTTGLIIGLVKAKREWK